MVSFQGVRRVAPKEVQKVQVGDYMTRKLICFHPDQSMEEVIHTLTTKKISGAPVVDDNNQLVGIISEGDCLKVIVKGKYNHSPNLCGRVRDHMSRFVKTMDPELNIFEAAQMFLTRKLRRFPVMKDGKLLGQISQRDIMRAIQNLKDETW